MPILVSHSTEFEGPMPIQRHHRVGWSGFTRTVVKIFADMGYAEHEDQNGPWVDGVFPTTINLDEHGRRARYRSGVSIA